MGIFWRRPKNHVIHIPHNKVSNIKPEFHPSPQISTTICAYADKPYNVQSWMANYQIIFYNN